MSGWLTPWNITLAVTVILIAIIIYSQRQPIKLPISMVPAGNPVLRLGDMEYDVEEVVPCIGFGWRQYGRPITLTLKEPLLKPFGDWKAHERRILIDDDMVTGRREDGSVVSKFDEKYNSDTILTIHKDYFEADTPEIGELKRIRGERDYERMKRIKLQGELTDMGSLQGLIDKVREFGEGWEELKRVGRDIRRGEEYSDRFKERYEGEKVY